MSGRRNANRIRGPQSALTDFLAANNISAQQIRDTYEQRNRRAEEQNAVEQTRSRTTRSSQAQVIEDDDDAGNDDDEINVEEEEEDEEEEQSPQPQSKKKRKRTEKAKPKGKHAKKHMKRKGSDDGSDDDYNEDSLGPDMYKKSKPRPGQLENCELCEKRFTVTPYSKTGPQGGLLCTPCGKDLAKDENNTAKKAKKAAPGKSRRKTESNRLDGLVSLGTKSLQQLCIEKVADHHLDIEEFGDLPDSVLNRLSQIFSKRRVMNPRTVRLFLRPDLDTVAIHDAADLGTDDFKQIFAVIPHVSKLILRNACQFKDEVLGYMMERAHNISHVQIYAANLISNEVWKQFFRHYGDKLQSLKLAWLDACFDDDVVATMVDHCPNLRRLKLKYCRKITSDSFIALTKLVHLEHLSLQISQPAEPEQLVPLINSLGSKLQTLSLEGCTEADDTIIDAIFFNCAKLLKFRLSDVDRVTDNALMSLFSPTSALPALRFVDLSSSRDVDNNNPNGPEDVPIGLAPNAFKTLMAYHGTSLQVLNIASCRHVSHDAFWEAFVGNHSSKTKSKKKAPKKYVDEDDDETPNNSPNLEFPITYPALRELNISFCNSVDTSIINGIFKCCPKLEKLIAFGCFKIEDVTVPNGVALIGVPRAQDAIEQIGGTSANSDMPSFLSTLQGLSAPGVGKMITVDA